VKMRQSLLGQAHSCHHRLQYILDPKIPYTTGVVRAMGTAIHAGHEMYYTHRQGGGDAISAPNYVRQWQECAIAAFDHEVERGGDSFDWVYQPQTARKQLLVLTRDDAVQTICKAIAFYHDNEHYWPEEYEVLAVEWYFDMPFPHHDTWTLSGTLDLILRHSATGHLKLVDHKNCKDKPRADKYRAHKTPQAAFYLWAVDRWLEELNVRPPERPLFVYDALAFDGSGFWRIEEARTLLQIEATMTEASMLATLIDNGGPYMPNTESFLCSESYCDFWHLCPFGATLQDKPQGAIQ